MTNAGNSRRRSPLWPAVLGFYVATAFVPMVCRPRTSNPPAALTIQTLSQDGRELGWDAYPGFTDADGVGVLFLDRKRNPDARVRLGVSQPGALYVVETASEQEAVRSADEKPSISVVAWGRFTLAGDVEMARALKSRVSPRWGRERNESRADLQPLYPPA